MYTQSLKTPSKCFEWPWWTLSYEVCDPKVPVFKKIKDKIEDSFEAMKCHMVIIFTLPWGTSSFELSVKQPARQCWKVAYWTVWTEQKLFSFWLLQVKSCFSSWMPFSYMNCMQSNWKVGFYICSLPFNLRGTYRVSQSLFIKPVFSEKRIRKTLSTCQRKLLQFVSLFWTN